jgi:hypothetical protein
MPAAARVALRLASALLLIACAGLLALSAPEFWRQYTVLKTWHAVEATVVNSRVIALPTGSGESLYDAEYTFAFAAGGGWHVARTGSNHQSTNQESKRRQVARFPAGSRHTILYNPADPEQIRMQPGYNVHFFAVPLFISGAGLICGMVEMLLAWAGARSAPHSQT